MTFHMFSCVILFHRVKLNAQYEESFLQYHLYHSVQKKHQDKGKVHPSTRHEGTEREYLYSSTFSFTSALDGDGWSMTRLSPLTPRKTQNPLDGPQGLSGWTKKIPHQDLIPVPCSLRRVTILTTLSWPIAA